MVEKLNSKRVALSLAIVVSIFYIACALLVVIAPDFTTKLFSNLFHGIDITQIATANISFWGVLIGLIEIIIYTLIAVWLFAWIYNKLK
jgi:small-conductance mechanosensitive channel